MKTQLPPRTKCFVARLFNVTAALLFFAVTAQGAPLIADYGDAPDNISAGYAVPYDAVIGKFPTRPDTTNSRYGLSGARTVSPSDSRLGKEITVEAGPQDPADPNGVENFIDDDFDDGLTGMPCPTTLPPFTLPVPPFQADLTFNVTVAQGAPAKTRYLNVLLDLNNDGAWKSDGIVGSLPEWIAIDFPVNVAPGTTQPVTISPFFIPATPVGKWMRAALTDQPITGTFPDDGSGWDGSGSFAVGEIEDYLVAGDAAYALMTDTAADFQFMLDIEGRFSSVFVRQEQIKLKAAQAESQVAALTAATIQADASAAAAASAYAETTARSAATSSACTQITKAAAVFTSSCASCPCATACSSASASVLAAASACAQAEAAAAAAASSAANAKGRAEAKAAAAAIALAEAQAQATAIAAASAVAEAQAAALAVAKAAAIAQAAASATAAAGAVSGACGADAIAMADAMAHARAASFAAAQAFAEADTWALAITEVAAEVEVEVGVLAKADAVVAASAAAAAEASADAAAAATAAATAYATTQALATVVAGASAASSASCSGDCCPSISTCVASQVHVMGPYPNTIFSGSPATMTAKVKSGTTPVWGQKLEFSILGGDARFQNGSVSPDGKTTTMKTKPDGSAQTSFIPNKAGSLVIRTVATDTPLKPTYLFLKAN